MHVIGTEIKKGGTREKVSGAGSIGTRNVNANAEWFTDIFFRMLVGVDTSQDVKALVQIASPAQPASKQTFIIIITKGFSLKEV